MEAIEIVRERLRAGEAMIPDDELLEMIDVTEHALRGVFRAGENDNMREASAVMNHLLIMHQERILLRDPNDREAHDALEALLDMSFEAAMELHNGPVAKAKAQPIDVSEPDAKKRRH